MLKSDMIAAVQYLYDRLTCITTKLQEFESPGVKSSHTDLTKLVKKSTQSLTLQKGHFYWYLFIGHV